jgi:hypothetical protein
LRIKYDDGDSEDFDMASLLKGLEMYNKYKDKDTLRSVVGNTVPTPTITPSAAITATASAIAADTVAVGNSMDKDDSNEEKKDDDNNMINKSSSNNKDIGSPSDANLNKTNNPTAKSDNPDGKVDKSTPSDPICEDSKNCSTANNALAASIHCGIGDEDAITKASVGHKRNILEINTRTYNGNVKMTFTGRSGGSNGNNDDNTNDNHDKNINNMGGGESDSISSSSSDEVEIVNVLTPYRGNPSLFEFSKPEGDDAIPKNNNGNEY